MPHKSKMKIVPQSSFMFPVTNQKGLNEAGIPGIHLQFSAMYYNITEQESIIL